MDTCPLALSFALHTSWSRTHLALIPNLEGARLERADDDALGTLSDVTSRTGLRKNGWESQSASIFFQEVTSCPLSLTESLTK